MCLYIKVQSMHVEAVCSDMRSTSVRYLGSEVHFFFYK